MTFYTYDCFSIRSQASTGDRSEKNQVWSTRNLMEQAIATQANRIVKLTQPSDEMLSTLEAEDFVQVSSRCKECF